MGEGILCKKGSILTQTAVSDYALICAKYPTGSSCACSKGSESFTAEGGTGLAAFAVTGSGVWTVTISDGMRTKSGSVTISAAGEVKTIQLSYPSDPVVSEEGVLLSAQNGLANGYSLGGNASMNGNAIRERDGGGFWLRPAVNLSGYSTLSVSGYLRSAKYGQSRICVGSSSESVFDIAKTPELYAVWQGVFDTLYTVTLNVASLNGAYYIGATSVGNNLEITGIVLS